MGSPWAWTVSPGAGTVSVAPNAQELAYLSQFTVQNTDVVARIVLPRCTANGANCDAFVMGRYTPAYNPTYYRVGLAQGAGSPDIVLRSQRSDGSNLTGDLDTHLPARDGAAVLVRVEFAGTNPTAVRARAWLDGTAEPATWLLDTTDATAAEQKPGMVGVRLRNEDTAVTHTFQVTSYQVTGVATQVSFTANPSSTAHWLYVVVDGQVSVYDIDNCHQKRMR